jgi:hypothetical protein
MVTGLIVVAALVGVVALLLFVWRHQTGTAARGIAAAGIRYNEIHGQGRPPEMPSVSSQTTAEGDLKRGV